YRLVRYHYSSTSLSTSFTILPTSIPTLFPYTTLFRSGSSTPILTDEHLDLVLDYESVGAAGSMLGTRALQVFDETTSVVRCVARWTNFYQHESCGKCTPCREGTFWMKQILHRLEAGQGSESDVDLLLDVAGNKIGRASGRERGKISWWSGA